MLSNKTLLALAPVLAFVVTGCGVASHPSAAVKTSNPSSPSVPSARPTVTTTVTQTVPVTKTVQVTRTVTVTQSPKPTQNPPNPIPLSTGPSHLSQNARVSWTLPNGWVVVQAQLLSIPYPYNDTMQVSVQSNSTSAVQMLPMDLQNTQVQWMVQFSNQSGQLVTEKGPIQFVN